MDGKAQQVKAGTDPLSSMSNSTKSLRSGTRFIKFPEQNKPVPPARTRVIDYGPQPEQDVQYNLQSNQNNFIMQLQKEKAEDKDKYKDIVYQSLKRPYQPEDRKVLKSAGVGAEDILKGEYLLANTTCALVNRVNNEIINEGQLVITNFKFLFIRQETDPQFRPNYFKAELFLIQKIDKINDLKKMVLGLDLSMKDMRLFRFRFLWHNKEEFERTTRCLSRLVQNDQVGDLPAWAFFKENSDLEKKHMGWQIYDTRAEYTRQKIKVESEEGPDDPTCAFRFVVNEKSQICSTYPPLLVFPNVLHNNTIAACARFRGKERLPVLSFAFRFYQADKGKQTSFLFRSSQSKPGITQTRSEEDEHFLRVLGNIQQQGAKEESINLHIYDARPYLNAMVNKLNGKGFENTQFYRNCDLKFLDIHNIKRVKESYKKIRLLCLMDSGKAPSRTGWFKALDETGYFDFLSQILEGANEISVSLKTGTNCLVHCSDGWDRTTQLVCLTQILLDPYFRTTRGFMVLIQKEWVHFGHKFGERHGHHPSNRDETQSSPVFMQFLDCVHQLMTQFPLSFEFSLGLLGELATHVHSCLFGTFLVDNWQEGKDQEITTKTVSIWSYLLEHQARYKNPFYLDQHKIDNCHLSVDSHPRALRLWKEYFLSHLQATRDPYKVYVQAETVQDNLAVLYSQSEQERLLIKDTLNAQNKELQALKAQLQALSPP